MLIYGNADKLKISSDIILGGTMKNRAVVSERGTITIPEPVRVLAGIHPGDLIEFAPQKDRIVLRHLVVKSPDTDTLSSNQWNQLSRQVRKQLKSGHYKSYSNLNQAKEHSRNLARGE